VNYLIIESLQKFHHYYGDDLGIECPTGSGVFMSICDVAVGASHQIGRTGLIAKLLMPSRAEHAQAAALPAVPAARAS
jgi:hypothetical protein